MSVVRRLLDVTGARRKVCAVDRETFIETIGIGVIVVIAVGSLVAVLGGWL